jgi:hypothetical protein
LRADHLAGALLGEPGAEGGAVFVGFQRRQRDLGAIGAAVDDFVSAGADVAD